MVLNVARRPRFKLDHYLPKCSLAVDLQDIYIIRLIKNRRELH